MGSLIEELQRDALSHAIPVEQLLLKARVVASKLALKEFGTWVDHELNGYREGDTVPEYRKIRGQLQGYDPYSGWRPVVILNSKTRDLLSSPRSAAQPIGQLEHIARDYEKGDALTIPLPPDIEIELSRETGFLARVAWRVDPSSIVGIVNAVRRGLLDWSLNLEAAGIKGEGMSFSEPEKTMAQDPRTIYQIDRVQNLNLMGNVGGSSSVFVSQTANNAIDLESARKLADQIKLHLDHTGLSTDDQRVVVRELQAVEVELAKPDADQSRVRRAFKAIERTMEGVASNVIASGIIFEIAKMLH